jgi:methylated-DNA-[protein]-cysteine S-methyltransferase
MPAILELTEVRAELTSYEIPGWGAGELWMRDGVVLAHDFDFSARSTDAPAAEGAAARLIERIRAFFVGGDVSFGDVRLDLDDFTQFQCAVAVALRGIPRGQTIAYGELAALAGHPGAQRAVGNFCAHNRFMFLVPCHRVVAADGIGPYGSAGSAVKRRLLALEGVSL